MDRDTEAPDLNEKPKTKIDGLEIKNIGTSAGYGKDALQDMKASVLEGASRIEIGFTGAEKGLREQGSTTPEAYGKEEREAMRELAKANEVTMQTHATIRMGTMSGFGEHGFNDEARQKAVFEIERAVDFARDVARGGSVVVHVGEWVRPIGDTKKYGGDIQGYPTEEDKKVVILADKDTGRIQQIPHDMKIWEPEVAEWRKNEKGEMEAARFASNADGTIKTVEHDFKNIVEWERENNPKQKGKTDEELFVAHFFKAQELDAHSQALRWSRSANEHKKELTKIKDALEFYKKIEAATDDEDKWKLKRAFESRYGGSLIPPDIKLPTEFLQERMDDMEKDVRWEEEAALSASKKVAEIKNNTENLKPIEEVGIHKTADTIARAAIYAYEQEKKNNLERPLFIAPENIFPEHYGGHPAELKKIIIESRKEMEKQLTNRYGEDKAKTIARDHIRATIDIGHAHAWRKFFKGDDESYNKWLVGQIKDLADSDILGNVHITDNFGYYDEHLAPGQGTAPIKQVMDELRKVGIKGGIVEGPIKFSEAVKGTSELSIANPIYATGGRRYNMLQDFYQGRRNSPYHTLLSYIPIEDVKPWSETPYE